MDKELAIIAAKAIKEVYTGLCENIGSTEFALTNVEYQGKPIQVLAIGGTSKGLQGVMDWIWNITLLSWDNVKLCSYISARRIHKSITVNPDIPFMVAVHSKSGPTGAYYKLKYGADYCICFCPAPGFRKAPVMTDTVLYIDEDDYVPMAGQLNFDHPICPVVTLPRDKDTLDVKGRIADHSIDHILEFLACKHDITG